MPRWSAYVTGDDHLIWELPRLLGESRYSCIAEGSGYRVFSSDFDRFTSASDVHRYTKHKISGVLAAVQIFGGRHGSLKCGSVREHNASGGKIRDTAFATMQVQVISSEQLQEAKSGQTGIPIASAVADLAEQNTLVARALEIVNSNGFGWPQLYDIIELLTPDLIIRRGWATRRTIRDIQQTANPHRHPGALVPNELPEKPPTLDEARAILRGILKAWVRERLEER